MSDYRVYYLNNVQSRKPHVYKRAARNEEAVVRAMESRLAQTHPDFIILNVFENGIALH